MRPIKLIIQAFGPYSKTEIIDFEELNGKNLFLITGATGSGKTTIFDAISFALYGKSSGNMRSSDGFRSDFSNKDTLTQVELEFELKGIRYKILRIPKQVKPKISGKGFTEQSPEATLKIYDCEPNKVICGIKNVDTEIEKIVGINSEQFKQIMMIPQGEFRKLLTSDSEDRAKVLQKLFDTKLYEKIQYILDRKSKDLYNDISGKKNLRDHEIKKINPADRGNLKELISVDNMQLNEIIRLTKETILFDKEEEALIRENIEKIKVSIQKTVEDNQKALNNNKLLTDKENTKKKIKEKETQADNINAKKTKVNLATKAQLIKPLEDNYIKRDEDIKNRNKILNIKEIENEEKKLELERAKQILNEKKSEENIKIRLKIQEEIIALNSYRGKVTNIESINNLLNTKTKDIDKLLFEKNKIIEENKNDVKSIEDLNIKKEAASNAKVSLGDIRLKINTKKELEKMLLKEVKLIKQIEEESILVINKDSKVKSLFLELKLKKNSFNEKKITFLLNQAAILAKDLKEGTPCPVCGSTSHSELAKLNEEALNQEQINVLEEQLNKEEEEYNIQNRELAILIQKRDSSKAQRDSKISVEKINAGIVKIKIEIDELTKEDISLNNLINQASEIDEKVTTIKAFKVKRDNRLEEILGLEKEVGDELLKNKTILKGIYEEVPENLRTIGKLNAKIREKEIKRNEDDQQLKKAQDNYDVLKNLVLEITTIIEEQKKEIKTSSELLKEDYQKLLNAIKKAEFIDIEDYKKAILSKDIIKEYETIIEEYVKEVHTLKEYYKKLKEATKDNIYIDTKNFIEQINVLNLEEESQNIKQNLITNRISNNSSILKEVKSINDAIGKKEKEYNVIGNLAKVAKGNNKARITFERYVLAAFLENILRAANTRLKKMTYNRYSLARAEDPERKNKQSGLELKVFDDYTGKYRHVKTLSGGESFKASLSMALGLADVVQSYAGGVQLDTMFVDEGFGTLDQESLDSAINCLIELQESGRLIGIISHVQELKERVETRLEVCGSNTGSTTKFVVGG